MACPSTTFADRSHRPVPTRLGSCGATNLALDIDAPGYVPWWPRPNVKLFNVLVHRISETNRHAGHADILREQLDGRTGSGSHDSKPLGDRQEYWNDRYATIEAAASAAAAHHGAS